MSKRKWNKTQQATFLVELGSLMDKGYSIADSLILLELQYVRQPYVPIKEIKYDLLAGTPLFESLETHHVPLDILGYLYFASEQGKLSFGLIEGGLMLQKREKLKKSFADAIRYPLVLITTLGMMIFFMIQFLFPQFTSLFQSVDMSLPRVTLYFISIIQLVPYMIYLFLIFLILFLILYRFKFSKKSPHEQLFFFMRLPGIHHIIKVFITQYFSFQIGHLLKGGLSINHALQLFENQGYVRLFQDEAILLQTDLRSGQSLSEIIQTKSYFLPELAQVIVFGQSKGRLGEELTQFSEMLLENMEARLRKWITFVQPILFTIVGATVLFLFLSVMTPIFSLFQSL